MRQEAWDLLQNQNRYSGADPEKNWFAFRARLTIQHNHQAIYTNI
jgi:hypothetical protein